MPHTFISLAKACGLAALAASLLVLGLPDARAEENVWPILKEQAFGDRPIQEEDGMVVLETPSKVEDAAIVPLTVRVPPSVKGELKSLTLFIDKNPDPKVATLTFGPAAGTSGERSFSTRVRVDNFSHVRAILETADGSLHMTTKFLAAAGGCAAMQAKDPDADSADMGKVIVRTFPPALDSNPIWAAQVMIKHPNHNGMQLDINTAKFIPARFVKEMTVKRDGELVFQLDGTFSISTNPNFRFTFSRGEENDLDVVIVDTDGTVFEGQTHPKGS
ncbi:sulfur oxidation protein SoxZ [Methyloceanibacter superfactus]|jgi:sulfur-oxidizing protein SoxY|uniref:Sulfur oxidation protein SoxZ n=1 Tax=Methyloceanibacter superfactus TaxID=1774969 RepID=A0A1E3W6R0_9HYPH|nr:quinoprotein dehydrogenase-associated SoxYZ-like carrier [Methyloceanibacter superfactus]ODS01525.1 sulfur oxidation protein SoxZ [Methyloceanibacter superfactus]